MNIDVNDPEYIRQLLRPATIKEDVKLMEQRSRVSLILKSPAFRKELEKIVASQMRDGVLSPNVMALKQLVDMLTPHAKLGSSAFAKGRLLVAIQLVEILSLSLFTDHKCMLKRIMHRLALGATVPVIPINDLRSQSAPYSKPEKVMRCKVASTYRLVDIFGWATGTASHISVSLHSLRFATLIKPHA